MFYKTLAVSEPMQVTYTRRDGTQYTRRCTLELQGGWFKTFRILNHFSDETEDLGRNVDHLVKWFPEFTEQFLGVKL